MDNSHILHRLIYLFKLKEDTQYQKTGLSAKELYVLEHIRDDPPWRFNDFAANHHIKPSTLTGIVERLEKKGLTQRQRDSVDRKAVFLHSTQQGKEIIKSHIDEDQIFFRSMLSALSAEEPAGSWARRHQPRQSHRAPGYTAP